MVVPTCRRMVLRLSRASSMHWLRSWKHVNARSVRKIKRMTPLHLLHPQLSESDVLDGARSNRNANRIAKFWKKTWFCPGLCQIAIKSKTADSKSLVWRAGTSTQLDPDPNAQADHRSVSRARVRAVLPSRREILAPVCARVCARSSEFSQGGEIGRRARLRIAKSSIS